MSSSATAASARESAVQGTVRNWKTPILLSVLGLLALLVFALGAPANDVTFRLSDPGDSMVLPDLVLSAPLIGWFTTLGMLALAGFTVEATRRGAPAPRWLLAAFAVLFLVGFLTWVVGSARTPNVALYGLLAGSVTLAVPLIFGSLSGVLCERSGVVNIAIEGQLLFGAFAAAVAASLSGSAVVGLFAAAAAGVMVSLMLAIFSIRYLVNQVIVGVVLNVLVSGLTGFLFSAVLSEDSETWNSPPSCPCSAFPASRRSPSLGQYCSSRPSGCT